ncbi:helix-turn-helix family protein [Clostridium botulinum]|uniref:helix-turn-helix domain-containing protein n=1 Tax=Clostridium botulinum TaxID=1491 RepID=UPI00046605E7|nr:helix-turn-helix transcriptional regulator [Clostridium botulinum]APR02164.1 helix-turn-helix family protein [Clostridium botulinum]
MSSTFGKRFKMLRLEKGLNQQELIDDFNKKYHYGFTKSAVSQYENDKRIPEIGALNAFANYFNVSIDFLLGKSDIRNMDNTEVPSLTKKDEKEIEKILNETKEKLGNAEGLMLNGELATPEAIQSILDAMKVGMEIAKQRNKKYTPDKYKKNK